MIPRFPACALAFQWDMRRVTRMLSDGERRAAGQQGRHFFSLNVEFPGISMGNSSYMLDTIFCFMFTYSVNHCLFTRELCFQFYKK